MIYREDFDKTFVIILSSILVVEMLIGLTANICVLVVGRDVMKRYWEKGNNFNMNLHVVDSVICIFTIPLTMVYLLTSRFQHPIFCLVFEGAVSFTSSASSLTLFFICLDRYFAMTAPTEPCVISRRTNVFIALVWLGACFAFCAPFFGFDVELFHTTNWTHSTCGDILWQMDDGYFYELIYIIAFLMTVIAMILFYCSVKRIYKKRNAVRTALVNASLPFGMKGATPRGENKGAVLSMGIVFAFLVFWGPHLVVTIITMFVRDSLFLDVTQILCLVFAFLTPVIHPILYAALRPKFREMLKRKLTRDTVAIGCASYNKDRALATIEVPRTIS
ncbi:hypothetical protein LOTGIDRAFT_154412 [Lottia gigantea]|uniref:G-protein coupled receptors family 1 profile domain-containing protein n=1 Tax=Lottia gigantea TaxID=225164 RepID=V3ZY15_LOTGI|nr:hypothetical protein LOTGIDRAFT_154412 [Lottia gigantea]ESO89312.1 hypothetical protein LOTGIDRAFT_154412 [Lottia gigantea]